MVENSLPISLPSSWFEKIRDDIYASLVSDLVVHREESNRAEHSRRLGDINLTGMRCFESMMAEVIPKSTEVQFGRDGVGGVRIPEQVLVPVIGVCEEPSVCPM